MNTTLTLTRTLSLVASLALVGAAVAEDKSAGKESKPAAAPALDEMMKKWMEIATPGPAHKLLDAFTGEWEVTSKWWMSPDAPPVESKGTSKVRPILGGRFIQEDHAGESMGKPMKGLGLTGYDNFRKQYVSLWIDDSGTGMFTCAGTADAAGKVLTFDGKMDDPMTGEKDKAIRCIVRLVSPDKRVSEMHEPARGEKSRIAELTYPDFRN